MIENGLTFSLIATITKNCAMFLHFLFQSLQSFQDVFHRSTCAINRTLLLVRLSRLCPLNNYYQNDTQDIGGEVMRLRSVSDH